MNPRSIPYRRPNLESPSIPTPGETIPALGRRRPCPQPNVTHRHQPGEILTDGGGSPMA